MKILMTGNPEYGLAKSFLPLRPDTLFASRNAGLKLDLSIEENQNVLAETSLNFDIFINNSYITHFAQMELCRKVWTKWKQNSKSGSIVNIGSTVRDLVRPDNRFYPTSKRALEDYSKQLHLYSVWGNSRIRVSCINFGGINTEGTLEKWPHFSHLDSGFCAELLNWAIQIPPGCNLDILQVSPIQPKTRVELRKTAPRSSSPSDYLIADFDEV